MYASRTVCSRCAASRMRLAVPQTHRTGTVAWFSSSPAAEDSAAFEQDTTTHAQQTTTHRGSHRRSFQTPHKSPNSLSFRREARKRLDQTSAVALFNDVVQRAGAGASSRGDSGASSSRGGGSATVPSSSSTTDHCPENVAASVLGEWEIAAKMKELSEMPLAPREKLRYFEENVWAQVKELRCRMPKHLYLSASMLLTEICDGVAQEGLTSISLTLSRMLGTIGKWDLTPRNQLVLNLCHALITRKHSSAERLVIANELLDMWKHLSQLMRSSQVQRPGEQPVCPQFVLPAVDEIMDEVLWASSPKTKGGRRLKQGSVSFAPTTRALASILIQFRLEGAAEVIPGLLATLAVLSDARLARETLTIEAAPLLYLVAVALEHQPPDESYIEDMFATSVRFPEAKLSEIQSYVVAQWPHVKDLLFSKDSAWRRCGYRPSPSSSSSSSSPHHLSSPHSILGKFHKKLRKAYNTRVTGAVISVWQDLTAQLAERPDLGRQLRDDPDLLDYCVFVWCAMQRPYKLQETLYLMQQLQVQPTVRTYTNMMHGWKIRKDWQRIEALWEKLVESGIKLDVFIWTGRISGLIESGKPQAGIHALAEMQGLWTKAVASTGGDAESAASIAIQPTIEVVNAALKGLITVDRHAANEVLSWAGREGIEPNIRTFNILLKASFQSGSSNASEGVDSLLKTMVARGVEPDGATFTIILEQLLGGMSNASADEQVQAVEQILSDMQGVGLKPNRETYGKMLHAVSSLPYGGADAAVAAVQRHMRRDGCSSTPHSVTILIERALSRDPLPANTGATIRSLLQQHHLTSIDQGDQTLWERVMSAYAVTGDVPAAMDLFRQLARAGRPVTSLPCLTDLLKALLRHHHQHHDDDDDDAKNGSNTSDAKEVVRVVLNHKLTSAAVEGLSDPERGARYWRHHFWFMAMEYSLLDWETVPAELERMLRG
ncbi:hypothetical protein E4U43_001853 [Claviceps pusilla]|uniref:Uncharacterized protein n=1 Tax=Claviceps pusilla TaxID=123648 RepID=A0A9P7N729_9HYPO|nr:hypothetical protein E4U43_001853 [Claviceps pusilla]